MSPNDITLVILWFFFYSIIGWLWEVGLIWARDDKLVNRGFLNGPYCPIYGVGALTFIFTTNSLHDPALRFFIGATLACSIEYITSFVLELIFRARWWDYSWRKFNLNGRICLAGFIFFGLAAVAMPHIHGWIEPITRSFPAAVTNSIASILVIGVLIDYFFTLRSLAKFNKALRDYQQAIDKRRTELLEFIRISRRAFMMRFHQSNKKDRNVLTYQQRRILTAFPNMTSQKYDEALTSLQDLNKQTAKAPRKPRQSRQPRRSKKSANKKASK